ncbi:hypothetical protein ABI_26930, partial [Asticcacaulis biprosthecium C19]
TWQGSFNEVARLAVGRVRSAMILAGKFHRAKSQTSRGEDQELLRKDG